jgi:hypothetical protein
MNVTRVNTPNAITAPNRRLREMPADYSQYHKTTATTNRKWSAKHNHKTTQRQKNMVTTSLGNIPKVDSQ